jgi:hypothetical protein
MLKYCGDELDPKSRTLLDYHPVEVARQMVRRLFVLVRASEVMSRLDEGRFIELAHCCRDVHRTCSRMYAVDVGLNQWAVQRLKGLWEKLPTKWEKRYGRARPALHSKSNSAAMRAAAALRARVGVAGV